MKLDSEKTQVQTLMGSLCSLLMFIIVFAYGYQKVDVWNTKKDIDIQYSTEDAYFTDDDVFDFKQGLNFAMAFAAYDTETEPKTKLKLYWARNYYLPWVA